MTTVKNLLETKFNEFIEKVKPIISDLENSFKVDGEVDYLDILDVVLFLFPDDQTSYNLDEFLDLKQIEINEDKKKQLIPILNNYLEFLRKLKKLL